MKLVLVHGAPPKAKPRAVDLARFLIGLVRDCRAEWAQASGSHTLSLGAKLSSGIYLSAESADILGFVIREIIANAYKHSHPLDAPVEVTLSCAAGDNGDVLMEIGDDGIGLPAGFEEWRDAGNGLISIRKKLQTIGAALNVTSDDLGLRFQIVLSPSTSQRSKPARNSFVWL